MTLSDKLGVVGFILLVSSLATDNGWLAVGESSIACLLFFWSLIAE